VRVNEGEDEDEECSKRLSVAGDWHVGSRSQSINHALVVLRLRSNRRCGLKVLVMLRMMMLEEESKECRVLVGRINCRFVDSDENSNRLLLWCPVVHFPAILF
jgi:hypothetical protein